MAEPVGRRKRWRPRSWWVAVATAVAAACGTAPLAQGQLAASTTQVPAAEETVDANTTIGAPERLKPPGINEPAARVQRQERRHVFPEPPSDLEAQYGTAPVMLPQGEILTDDLGIELTLTLEDWWRLESASAARILLAPPENPIGRLRPNLVFIRPVGYFDPILAGYVDNFPGDQTLPADGLQEWLEGMDQVVVTYAESFSLGDRSVTRYDVDLDPTLGPTSDDCSPGNCVALLWHGGSGFFVLRDAETVRYYEIEDPAGPVLALVAADEGDNDFLERSDALIRSVRLGSSAPHPVPDDVRVADFSVVDPGEWGVAAIPDIRLNIAHYSYFVQRPGQVITGHPVSGGASQEIAQPLTDGQGRPLRTVEELLTAISSDADWDLTEGDLVVWRDAEGIERSGRVFTVATSLREDDPTPPALLAPLEPGDDPRLAGWPDAPQATFVATQTEDERVFAIGTEASPALSDDALADVLDFARSIRFSR